MADLDKALKIKKNVIIECEKNFDGDLVIPDSVKEIGASAFSGCIGLTSVVIPASVNTIGNSSFEGCSGLTSIVIPDSVTEIGDYAFSGCSGLTSIVIPDSIEKIGKYAFWGCDRLPEKVKDELSWMKKLAEIDESPSEIASLLGLNIDNPYIENYISKESIWVLKDPKYKYYKRFVLEECLNDLLMLGEQDELSSEDKDIIKDIKLALKNLRNQD